MKLKALLRGLELLVPELVVKGSKEVEISGLSADSRCVAPGHLFIARKGTSFHGSQFIPQALRSGAAAIVTDLYDPSCSASQIIVSYPERLEAVLAEKYYGSPSKELFVAAVTGSKGKTTVCYLVGHLLNAFGMDSGLISTVETVVAQEHRDSSLTTHFPIFNHKILREIASKGGRAAALEASSHGLEQGRIDRIELDAAIWTNLYPDHLDFHGSVDKYAEAKRHLFALLDQSKKKRKIALLNGDDAWCMKMKKDIASPIWTFGLGEGCDLAASSIEQGVFDLTFDVAFEGQKRRCALPLMGQFNVYNALGALGVALFLKIPLQTAVEALGNFPGVPGRMQSVPNDRGVAIFVDYAHTGESLQRVLTMLRQRSRGKIICVFGCGGERDPERRSSMGKAADLLADTVIVTTDNSRRENPDAIIQQIIHAFQDPRRPIVEPDRKEAIRLAISMANPNDIVLIAGKGHEKVQIIGQKTIAFCDVSAVEAALQEVGAC